MLTVGQNLGLGVVGFEQPKNSSRSPSSSNSSQEFAEVLTGPKTKSESAPKEQKQTVNEFDAESKLTPPPQRDIAKRLPEAVGDRNLGPNRAIGNTPVVTVADTPQKVEAKQLDESVDNLAHRQALQQFLKRMKDELGIDAESIVSAFAELTPEELVQPPEQSLGRILELLQLNPEQQVAARAIFQQMLKQTAANDMAEYLKSSQRQLSLGVVSQREAQKREISRSVDQMQSQFFAAPQVKAPQAQPAELISRYQKVDAGAHPTQSKVSKESSTIDWQALGMAPVAAPAAEAATIQAAPVASAMAQPVAAPQPQAVTSPNEFFVNQQQGLKEAAFMAAPVVQAPTLTAPPSAPVVSEASGSISGAISGLMSSPEFSSSSADSSMDESSDEGSEQSTLEDQFQSSVVNGFETNEPMGVDQPESFMIQTQPTDVQESKNIREVIQRAQFLASKGGGEMKVIMNPEGLGEVTMKVAVEKGQIQIEMLTESNEAKKILEKGLGDLKATLMSHNLKVDQIRIDTPSDVSRQLTQNNDEAQRQFAQQFMEQFRQDNNQWRRGFFDIPGARMYGSQREEAERGQLPSPEASRRKASSRRLDLVA